jgi:hypothetical protein
MLFISLLPCCLERLRVAEFTTLPKYKQSRWNAYLGLFILRARIADYTLDHRIECWYVGRFESFGVEEVIQLQSTSPAQAKVSRWRAACVAGLPNSADRNDPPDGSAALSISKREGRKSQLEEVRLKIEVNSRGTTIHAFSLEAAEWQCDITLKSGNSTTCDGDALRELKLTTTRTR